MKEFSKKYLICLLVTLILSQSILPIPYELKTVAYNLFIIELIAGSALIIGKICAMLVLDQKMWKTSHKRKYRRRKKLTHSRVVRY